MHVAEQTEGVRLGQLITSLSDTITALAGQDALGVLAALQHLGAALRADHIQMGPVGTVVIDRLRPGPETLELARSERGNPRGLRASP